MEPTLRNALKEQYHAGLAMLAECAVKCPDDLWVGPRPDFDHRPVRRDFWRIVFHAAYGTHLMMGPSEGAFPPWADHRPDIGAAVTPTADIDPYELPESTEPYSREGMLRYIQFVDGLVDATVEELDLGAPETGFALYPNMTKLSHQLMTLRHLQGHVGQLSELLNLRGIDVEWVNGSGFQA